jgi:hypothetical protein
VSESCFCTVFIARVFCVLVSISLLYQKKPLFATLQASFAPSVPYLV